MLQVSAGQLVGRAAEFGRLTRLLDQAAAGTPVVALVSGDAGMGKTRLVAEVATVAAGQGFMVLSGRCAELGDSVPYLPLADALRSATAGQAPPALVDAIAARPVLGLLLPDRNAAEMAGGEVLGMAQQQLFGAVLGMLAELAGTAPVLLVLEDMHWADRSTRDLLTFLSRVLHRERIVVIATYRTDDLHRGHPLRAVAAELARLPSVTAVEVGPLSDGAIAEHLTALAPAPLEAASLETIIRRAEGNAYYAEELLAASTCGSDLPAGLADLLLARLQRLSPDGQRVVHAAAVAGRGWKTTWSGWRAASTGRSTTRRSGRRSRTSSWSRTARRVTRSGTRCCARRPTLTCCPGSGPGCTPGWPSCSRTRYAWPSPGAPPNWRITASPATTSPVPSARRCARARRRSGWRHPPRHTGTTTRRSPCGTGSPTQRSSPTCSAAGWPSSPRRAPPPVGSFTARYSNWSGCSATSPSRTTRYWCAGRTNGSPTTSSRRTGARRPFPRPAPGSTRCRKTRRRRSGPGRWPSTRSRC